MAVGERPALTGAVEATSAMNTPSHTHADTHTHTLTLTRTRRASVWSDERPSTDRCGWSHVGDGPASCAGCIEARTRQSASEGAWMGAC